jgi:hypothetical protein
MPAPKRMFGPTREGLRMTHLGWPYPAHPRPWDELEAFYAGLGDTLTPIGDVIESVRDSASAEALAAFTSMHDLLVIELPTRKPPYDVLRVRILDDGVEIEHLSPSGHNDRIHRPADAAVPLFWRFAMEKFALPDNRESRG